MNDEKYSFVSDVIEKKTTARSARNRRTHTGKGGRVRLPSDNLSKKELEKMNGEVKTFKLNSPMTKAEFQSMPDDLKAIYIKLIREKYGVPDSFIGNALGYSQQGFSHIIKKLGLCCGKKSGGKRSWDKDGFYSWWNGIDLPTAEPEEPTQEEDAFVEDDLPFEVPEDPVVINVMDELPEGNPVAKDHDEPFWAIPESGSMDFTGRIENILDSVRHLLGGANVRIRISWDVQNETGECENGN